MWVFFENGTFYSAVTDRSDPEVKWVRSRDKHSAEFFADWLGSGTKILQWPGRDYAYRVKTTPEMWAIFADEQVRAAKASNFKDEVKENRKDPKFLRALTDVWGAMWEYQYECERDA